MLCMYRVCDVTLFSHFVPSVGFNSLSKTQAKKQISHPDVTDFRNLVKKEWNLYYIVIRFFEQLLCIYLRNSFLNIDVTNNGTELVGTFYENRHMSDRITSDSLRN